jgi:hypothetical protein
MLGRAEVPWDEERVSPGFPWGEIWVVRAHGVSRVFPLQAGYNYSTKLLIYQYYIILSVKEKDPHLIRVEGDEFIALSNELIILLLGEGIFS